MFELGKNSGKEERKQQRIKQRKEIHDLMQQINESRSQEMNLPELWEFFEWAYENYDMENANV